MNKIIIILLLALSLQAAEIYATFNVQAQKSANLAFDAGGIVHSVYTDIASSVKKGTLLASLNNSDKKALLESAKTALKFAKKDYERQVKVKNLINEAVFDSYAFKYENAKNQLALQEAMYAKTLLYVPFDGVIFYKNIEVGDTVSGVQLQTVYKIQSKSARKLILEFDQKYSNSVSIGDIYKYKIGGDTKTYSGIISKIYPFANSNNRKIQAEVEASDILVGLFGTGTIITKEK